MPGLGTSCHFFLELSGLPQALGEGGGLGAVLSSLLSERAKGRGFYAIVLSIQTSTLCWS